MAGQDCPAPPGVSTPRGGPADGGSAQETGRDPEGRNRYQVGALPHFVFRKSREGTEIGRRPEDEAWPDPEGLGDSRRGCSFRDEGQVSRVPDRRPEEEAGRTVERREETEMT